MTHPSGYRWDGMHVVLTPAEFDALSCGPAADGFRLSNNWRVLYQQVNGRIVGLWPVLVVRDELPHEMQEGS